MAEENLFQVRVEDLHFDAAHFATFGGTCEPLHGHTYGVAVEIDGHLDADSWVLDFVELKALVRQVCDELDHKMLLQSQSSLLHIEQHDGIWKIRTPGGRSYELPVADVAALPLDNTTAERLAEFVGHRLTDQLRQKGVTHVSGLGVEIWEGPSQRAAHRRIYLPLG